MLPAIIEYLLTLKWSAPAPGIYNTSYQVIIPNFPSLTTINYTVAPAPDFYAYILYEFVFGQSMVPHSFDIKLNQAGSRILDTVISGRFTTSSMFTFAMVTQAQPIEVAVTNLRLLVNYYELTTFYASITTVSDYNAIIDALQRVYTSTKSEKLAGEIRDFLQALGDKR